MAYGLGKEYWGNREKQPDGSYITTKFFSIALPLIPLGSYRVWSLGETKDNLGNDRFTDLFWQSSQEQRWLKSQRVQMNWRQVGNVYLFDALVIIFFGIVLPLAKRLLHAIL